MITITSNMHIVLLEPMRGNTELGLFAAARKPFNFTIVLPNPIATLFLPRIANLTRRPAERMRTTMIYMQTIIVSAVPITLLAPHALTADPDRPVRCALSSGHNNTWRAYLNNGFGTPLIAVGHSDIVCPKLSRGFGIAYSSLRRPVPDSGDTGSDRGSLCIDAADYRRL